VEQLRLVEQRRPAPVAIDRGRRAAEVEVDARRVEPRQLGRVVGHAGRVGAEQLDPHRRAAGGGAAGPQLGEIRVKARAGSTEPDTRANSVTAGIALDAGQHLAQHVVGEAFHGGEQEAGHGRNIQRIQDFRGRLYRKAPPADRRPRRPAGARQQA
jgi:hypothetical protein